VKYCRMGIYLDIKIYTHLIVSKCEALSINENKGKSPFWLTPQKEGIENKFPSVEVRIEEIKNETYFSTRDR
jgi:hypothetical protein